MNRLTLMCRLAVSVLMLLSSMPLAVVAWRVSCRVATPGLGREFHERATDN